MAEVIFDCEKKKGGENRNAIAYGLLQRTAEDKTEIKHKNGDIYKISAYADTSADEFFAECFAMKQMGKEKLPAKIDKMMEDVLKPWQR